MAQNPGGDPLRLRYRGSVTSAAVDLIDGNADFSPGTEVALQDSVMPASRSQEQEMPTDAGAHVPLNKSGRCCDLVDMTRPDK